MTPRPPAMTVLMVTTLRSRSAMKRLMANKLSGRIQVYIAKHTLVLRPRKTKARKHRQRPSSVHGGEGFAGRRLGDVRRIERQ